MVPRGRSGRPRGVFYAQILFSSDPYRRLRLFRPIEAVWASCGIDKKRPLPEREGAQPSRLEHLSSSRNTSLPELAPTSAHFEKAVAEVSLGRSLHLSG